MTDAITHMLAEALKDLLDRVERNGGLGEYTGGRPFAVKHARNAMTAYDLSRAQNSSGDALMARETA